MSGKISTKMWLSKKAFLLLILIIFGGIIYFLIRSNIITNKINREVYEKNDYIENTFNEAEEVETTNKTEEKKEIIPFKEIVVLNEYITKPNEIKRKTVPDFMQGLYVTAYKTRLKSFDSLLQEAKNSGINTIVFDVKEMKGHVYFSIKDHDQLRYTYSEPLLKIDDIVEKIHSHGFYAVARIVQFFNIETATNHPELQPTHKDGGYWNEKVNTPSWLDSSNPIVQSELFQIIDIVASSNVDEIQLDYVRFPTEGKLSNAVFYFQGEDTKRSIENEDYQKREKRDIIRDYVRDLRRIVDRHNVKLSADIFAIVAWQRSLDIQNTGQDISYLSPYLHNIHPMIYSSHFSNDFAFPEKDFIKKPYSIVKHCLEQTIKYSHVDCRVIPYLQAFGWRVDYTKEYVFDQLKATVDSESKGYIFWNANSNYDKTLEWVKEWNIARQEGIILDGYYIKKDTIIKVDDEVEYIEVDDNIDIEIE